MKALAILVIFGLACAGQEQPATPIPPVYTNITVAATPSDVDPAAQTKPSEVFSKTLFSRDDQIFHVLDRASTRVSTRAAGSRSRSGGSDSTSTMAA